MKHHVIWCIKEVVGFSNASVSIACHSVEVNSAHTAEQLMEALKKQRNVEWVIVNPVGL